ncbi:MAG: hypothetical protein U9Q98_02990 [Bacteroidota bacterium]|nr:hypothetical protein [Bacteroidota bacterium]
MKTLTSILLTLALSLMSLCSQGQKHGISLNSNIGLSGLYVKAYSECCLNLFQRYAMGYTYQIKNWSFGMNLYYMDHRFGVKYEAPVHGNGPMITHHDIYSSRYLGISPFAVHTIIQKEKYSISLMLIPGIDNIFLAKQYIDYYPSDDPDDVTVVIDWGKYEYGNYDQINFNLTLALEASRSFNENISLSGGVFLFSYLHNYVRDADNDKVHLPYAFGFNLGITYYFTPSGSSEN